MAYEREEVVGVSIGLVLPEMGLFWLVADPFQELKSEDIS